MPPNNFELILDQLRDDRRALDLPVYAMLSLFLTYDGRQPLEHALDALTDLERKLFESAEGRAAPLARQPAPAPGAELIRVFYNGLGRLHLRRASDPPPCYPDHVGLRQLGYFGVPRSLYAELEQALRPDLAEEARLRSLIDGLLCDAERGGTLPQITATVEDAVRHVEAVCIYVDDELWSVMERCTTLIDTRKFGAGLLAGLRRTPLASWTPAQRLGVAGLYALYQSGRSMRFEEFNGKVLTARRLFARLHDLDARYRDFDQPAVAGDADLFELAEAVGRAAQNTVGQPWLRYRWINGLTYLKTERIADTPPASAIDQAIPGSIADLYEAWLGRPLDRRRGYEAIFAELADYAIGRLAPAPDAPVSPAKSALELLIQEIVAAAVLAAQADYGMSSSLRDPSLLLGPDHATRVRNALGLQPKDFFTCLVSRPGLSEQLGERIKQDVYAAVQARMQYNRWHFIAGNFARADIPTERHHFYPPVVPDLAEWSDQQHGGHTQGGVRFSVRAPGPDMNQSPLMIGGHPYRGFYDVRVVRMEGSPFSVPEMLLTRHHSLWMGVVWRRIVAHCERNPGALRIAGFEKGNGYEIRET